MSDQIAQEDENFFDIDKYEDDPLFVPEYSKEIYENLKKIEHLNRPIDYIGLQPEITVHLRSMIVDWLVEVCQEFRLSSQTLHITIASVDRYLSKKQVFKKGLRLVGITCILIASKYEEIYYPSLERLCFICDKIYNRNDILTMEKYVLKVLDFNLSNPTIKDFLRRYMNASRSDKVELMLANYLCELSLLEYNFILFPHSLIAASAIYLARLTLKRKPWNTTLEHYSQYSESLPQFKNCIKELYLVHKNASTSEFSAVQERYSQEVLEKVSSIEPVENFEISPP